MNCTKPVGAPTPEVTVATRVTVDVVDEMRSDVEVAARPTVNGLLVADIETAGVRARLAVSVSGPPGMPTDRFGKLAIPPDVVTETGELAPGRLNETLTGGWKAFPLPHPISLTVTAAEKGAITVTFASGCVENDSE